MISVVLVVAYRYQTIKARSVGVGELNNQHCSQGGSIEQAMFNALGTASSRLSSSAGHETFALLALKQGITLTSP